MTVRIMVASGSVYGAVDVEAAVNRDGQGGSLSNSGPARKSMALILGGCCFLHRHGEWWWRFRVLRADDMPRVHCAPDDTFRNSSTAIAVSCIALALVLVANGETTPAVLLVVPALSRVFCVCTVCVSVAII